MAIYNHKSRTTDKTYMIQNQKIVKTTKMSKATNTDNYLSKVVK